MAFLNQVNIVSAEKEIFSGKATMVYASTDIGELGIAPHHAQLIATLRPGEVRLTLPEEGGEEFFYVSGGIIEVQPSVVTILADTGMRAVDIDVAAALKAKEQARKALSKREGKLEYAVALAQMAEAAAQLRAIADLRKKTRI